MHSDLTVTGKVLVTILLIVPILLIFVFINYKFYSLTPTNLIYDGCHKVWGHRGYHKDYPQNSIESFSEAFNRGAHGVELDIFFDVDLQDFIVSRDYPYNLKNNELLTLEKVFSSIGNKGYFWIDFKQLGSVPKIDIVIDKLENLLMKYNLFEKVIIESPKGVRLRRFAQRGMHTSYWLQPSSNKLLFWIKEFGYRAVIAFSNFSAISMDSSAYTTYIKRNYSHLPIHLFTVNDKQDLVKLVEDCSVKIVLSDEDYYSLKQGSCSN